jgi:TatD DNase family protein
MYFDTHVHFEHEAGPDGVAALLERARAAGVTQCVAVGATPALNAAAIEAARRFPKDACAAIGHDRDQAARLAATEQGAAGAVADLGAQIRRLQGEGVRIAAVGEIGLDFHYAPDTADQQTDLFRRQLRLAAELELPVIVHSREADRATIAELEEYARQAGRRERLGVLHCFTGTREFADELLGLGFHISFSGIVTFRNADPLRAVAAAAPADRLLIETDTPYLAPVPHRGKRNEPAFVVQVAETLARVRGCPVEAIARQTNDNAGRLFGG